MNKNETRTDTGRDGRAWPAVSAPLPFGAHTAAGGAWFRIFSRHAKRVWLLLFRGAADDKPFAEIEFDGERDRLGDVWQRFVPGVTAGMHYVYRMDGPAGDGNAYDPRQWLLDPYALAVSGSGKWGDGESVRPGEKIKNGRGFPKGVVVDGSFDWEGDRRLRVPMEDAVIYEASVRGYTAHPSSGVAAKGTYRGLIGKIPHLREMGVTTLELLPMQEFDEMELLRENGARRGLRNFWGYSTQAFFAPNGRFAADNRDGAQVREFKEMVKAMHKAGIEVILDIVFNHTAEGGPGAQTYSFRGIDNRVYYMLEGEGGKGYKNYTGCGNTVNCNHPVVRDFIVDCLRYWATEMHVDGFRFDLATILTRGRNGEPLANPPVVEQIADDPVLRGVKLIAEAWDAAGLYQVGSFPNPRWSEWNGKFRDDIREFWRGTPGMLGTFATRLCGSPDLYAKDGQGPRKSVNYIASHDGFTTADITAYSKKRNLANCEDNRDGDNDNRSDGCGKEGPTKDAAVLARRERRRKNLLGTLMLSQGVPMLLGGDEFARTQQGNNNAYCQDNAISWVDWRFAKKHAELAAFVKEAIAFRRAHPALRRSRFFSGHAAPGEQPDIRWVAADGAPMPDWHQDLAVACRIDGRKALTGADTDDDDLFLAFNAGKKEAAFELPAEGGGRRWRLAFRTDGRPEAGGATVRLGGESLAAYVCPRR